jgi:hypothetical protein
MKCELGKVLQVDTLNCHSSSAVYSFIYYPGDGECAH